MGCGTKLVVLLVLGGLFFYLVLPPVLESLIASRLDAKLESTTKPEVEVSSRFPPMMLLGSIDQVQVSSDQIGAYYDARVKLSDVSVSVPSLIVGNLEYETERCFVKARGYKYQECSNLSPNSFSRQFGE